MNVRNLSELEVGDTFIDVNELDNKHGPMLQKVIDSGCVVVMCGYPEETPIKYPAGRKVIRVRLRAGR